MECTIEWRRAQLKAFRSLMLGWSLEAPHVALSLRVSVYEYWDFFFSSGWEIDVDEGVIDRK